MPRGVDGYEDPVVLDILHRVRTECSYGTSLNDPAAERR